ncbi:class I SAM-dependent methyltransferase [Krasilnikoviella flava]|uniref:Methyltransferase domain-containing protein n=1 Tax=Krasilnikoviella flava TaxID=526729 RepID=A0A1T5LZF0_9MICO|nr:methyltransferase domain-containing protein [Krasilnikoviella flava]SKC81367.1 Methyltransferase domain-containing protein [Krasilnikoviella flava]
MTTSPRGTEGAAHGVRLFDDVHPDEAERAYLPGMSSAWKMPWYDVQSWWRRAGQLHRRTVEIAGIAPGQHVLDVGCGTGNLALTVLRAVPDAVVTGLDPDGAALRRAARKARRRRIGRRGSLTLVRGFADRLPAPDASVDHVLSSLALHHVPMDEKRRFAAELARVLRRGGHVTIADLDAPGHGGSEHGGSEHGGNGDGGHRAHRHGGHHEIGANQHREDNADGGIQRLLTDAGLTGAREVGRATFMDTPVVWVQARRP